MFKKILIAAFVIAAVAGCTREDQQADVDTPVATTLGAEASQPCKHGGTCTCEGHEGEFCPHHGDEFPRIFLTHTKPGVNQGAVSGVRDEPLPRLDRFELHGPVGAKPSTHTAAFAFEGIDTEGLVDLAVSGTVEEDRVELAHLVTSAAGRAMARLDTGPAAAHVRLAMLDSG